MSKVTHKGHLWRTALLIGLIMAAFNMSAQTLTITPNVQSDKAVPVTGTTLNALQGSGSVSYEIGNFNPGAIRSVQEAYYEVNGERHELSYTLTNANADTNGDKNITISEYPTISFDEAGDYSPVSVTIVLTKSAGTLTYKGTSAQGLKVWPDVSTVEYGALGDKFVMAGTSMRFSAKGTGGYDQGWVATWSTGATGQDITYVPTNTANDPKDETVSVILRNYAPDGTSVWYESQKSFEFAVYSKPSVSAKYTHRNIMFAGESIGFTADSFGGNPDGWTYEWTGVDSSDGATATLKTIEGKTDYSVSAVVRNLSPNGDVYLEETVNFPLTVYPTPSVEWTEPERKTWLDGENLSFLAMPSGGATGEWTYEWRVDGQVYNDLIKWTNRFEYTAVNKTSAPVKRTITATLTNTPNGIATPYSQTFTYECTVYPTPTLSDITCATPVVFNGTAVTLNATTAGGNPEGWSYSWTRNGNAIEGADGLSLTETTNIGNQPATWNYELTATNNYGGSSPEVLRKEFSVTIYPTPSANIVPAARTEWFNGENVALSTEVSGGDASAWTYSWTVDDQSAVATSSNYNYLAFNTGTSAVERKIKVTMTNTPAGIDKAYSVVGEYDCIVYPDPAIAANQYKNVVFNGTDVTMSVTQSGGKPTEWRWEWTLDGATVGSSNSLTITAANTGNGAITQTYKLKATNTIDETVKTLTQDFEVTIWPTPTATLATPDKDMCYSGDDRSFTITPAGGDPTAWTYTWVADETVSGKNASYSFTAINNNVAPAAKTVKVTAVNSPAGIDEPVTINFDYNYTVYSIPVITKAEINKPVVYSGTEYTMLIETEGGNPDKWSYTWTKDGVEIGGNSTILTDTPTNTGTAPITYIYKVRGVNTVVGNKVVEHEFTTTVWPSASATLTPPARDKWFAEETFSINVNPAGGDPEAWTYDWKIDNTVLNNHASPSYEYTVRNPGARKMTVTATNSPAGIDAPFTETFVYDFTVYATPSVTIEQDKQVVFSGTDVKMSVIPANGYPEGWSYTWRKDGTGIGDDSAILTDAPVNYGVDKIEYRYDVTATNTLDDQVKTFTESFYVTVWSMPETSFPTNLPQNIVSGDVVEMPVAYRDGDGNAWKFVWKVDGKEVQNSAAGTYEFTGINTNENASVSPVVTVEVTNSPEGIDKAYTATYSHTFVVWPGPSTTMLLSEKQVTCDGRTLTLGVNYHGGQSGEWTFDWTLNGAALTNHDATLPVTFANTNPQMRTDVYTVKSTNMVEGEIRYERTDTYTVDIYHSPQTTQGRKDWDAYYDGIVALLINPAYGYPDGWKYEWSDQLPNANEVEYTIPSNSADSYIKTVTVRVTNGYEDVLWSDETYTFDITCWSRGEIHSTTVLDEDYNGTITELLNTAQKGGYDKGWTYQWYLNGKTLTNGQPSLEISETNYGEKSEYYDFSLVAINTLEGVEGCRTTMHYIFTLWPVMNVPEAFEVSQMNVRNNTPIVLNVTPQAASGGYEYYWVYDWTANGAKIEGNQPSISTVARISEGSTMAYGDIVYGLTLTNPGPKGNNWYQQTFETKTVRVYNRPQTPTKLERKGNGTTCTMVVLMTPLSNGQLEQYNYKYVFGYTDASGVEHAMPAVGERYYRFDSNIYNNSSNRFWVYSLWSYDNGVRVTSVRRYLDGSTDDFDGSSFETGRGDSAGLDEITGDDNEILVSSQGFTVNLSAPSEATVSITNTAGAQVYYKEYPMSESISGRFSATKLTPGVYILSVKAGATVKYKKIVIK